MDEAACDLCIGPGGRVLHENRRLRVVLVDEQDYPGFIRVIWNAHVRELTDLAPEDRAHLMHAVFAAEGVLRRVMQPLKMNVASLGNLTPHLHWHVIPRFADDPHFPGPVWAERRREPALETLLVRRSLLHRVEVSISAALQAA
jgi:diadenosine tetraphosphate (Ap4A) HIT family hydrolase